MSDEKQTGGETVLEEAIRLTSADRQADYGHPAEHFHRTAAALNARFCTGRAPLFARPMEPQEWALMMALDKLAGRGQDTRAMKRDSLVDAAGYCRTYEKAALPRPLCDSCARRGRGSGCEWPQSGVQSCGQYARVAAAWVCPWCGGTETWFDRTEEVDPDGSVSGMATRCTQCGHATDDVPDKTDRGGER